MEEIVTEIERDLLSLSIENRTPYSVQIEVTTDCNWRCRHCYIPCHDNIGLAKDTMHNLFIQMRKMGVFEVTLTGGEIFLRSDILDIVRDARKFGFRVFLFSNISLLDEAIIRQLQRLYISEISCTIFSMNAAIHDVITQTPGSLSRTLNNLKILKRYGIPVEVKTIIMNVNFNDWRGVLDFCQDNGYKFGVDYDVFAKIDGCKEPFQLRITKEQMCEGLLELDKIKGFEETTHKDRDYVCSGIRNSLFIDSYGDVYPCVKYRRVVGNIKTCSLIDIWNESEELIRLQNIRWSEMETCTNCKINRFCFFCPGTALLEDGSEYTCSSLAYERAYMRSRITRDTV